MITAAGILFLAPDGTALFLKRGAGGDYPGFWCFPGGKQEGEESLEACAAREAQEECGAVPAGKRLYWTRQVRPALPAPDTAALPSAAQPGEQVDFTTFVQRVDKQFVPTLDGEHTGYAWAPMSAPPEPMHPGCQIALDRFGMNELDIARAMAAGQLTSPQRYENVTLFAIRITGTGVAYRRKLVDEDGKIVREAEFVWRDPSLYMNDEFLARCNGLPVIFYHPKKATLDSEEFAGRIVGTVFLPYLRPELNEVWAIAKIYDDDAIALMSSGEIASTSPAVAFRSLATNTKITLENGETLLMEGEPDVTDHIAICAAGVWDKGGAPRGISTTTGEVSMTEEEKVAAEKAKADGEKLDKLLTGLDSIGKRLDSNESKLDSMCNRMDAVEAGEKKRADDDDEMKRKADSEEKENAERAKADADEKAREEKAKADAEARVKADSDTAERIKALEARLPAQMSDADMKARAETQARADAVFQAFGDAAPRALEGETPAAYRRRLASKLKAHSPAWKSVELSAIADDAAFAPIEAQIYSDAVRAADKPTDLPDGQIQIITRVDQQTGIRTITGRGNASFVRGLKRAPRGRVARFKTGSADQSVQA